jgi:hypothetical protein
MKRIVIRETAIYLLLLVTFAFLMHPDLLSAPGSRLALMHERGNYFHPLLYAAFIYITVLIFRGAIHLLGRLLSRSKEA